jgi:Kef-type K+ transport system membrane component KefB
MSNEISIILILSLIIFSSPLIAQAIKIPTIPVEIILGSFAISSGLIHHNHIFELVAELGFLYLMFLAGLEINLKKVLKLPFAIIQKAFIYTFLLYVLSTLTTYYLNLANIFIVTLPLISIGLIATLKKEYGDVKWINLAITVGLIGEIVSIVVLTIVSARLEFGVGFEFYKSLIVLAVVFIVMYGGYKMFHNLIWWFPAIKTKLMPQKDIQEQDIRASMAIFFMMIALMLYLHLEVALGTFIAGVFIATFFQHNKELPHKLEHFGFGWLVPIFFVWIGTSFELKSLFIENLVLTALLISVAMILIRAISSLLFVKDIGLKHSMFLALSHSMPLTLLIAVATLAFHNNSITKFYYFAFILSAIFEVLISMILIRVSFKKN